MRNGSRPDAIFRPERRPLSILSGRVFFAAARSGRGRDRTGAAQLYGNHRDRAVPNLGWRITPSAGAKRRLRFCFRQAGLFCRIDAIVNGLRLSLPPYGEQAEAIYTDFTGTRHKSRVSFWAECLGHILDRVRSRQLARKGRGRRSFRLTRMGRY
jgi:hypothetical protein